MNGSELARQAFVRLFPGKDPLAYTFSLDYSGKFSDFNANARMRGKMVEFSLSKSWESVDDEIVMGLIQDLLLRLFREKGETDSIRLYHLFQKNVHKAAEKTAPDPLLEVSFHRVNDRFFYGMVDMPNLRFGKPAKRTMGSYNYHTDTITVSELLRGAEEDLVDYVMYHELLHKKMKFDVKGGRTIHHSSEFRRREKEYPGSEGMEKRLAQVGKRKRWLW